MPKRKAIHKSTPLLFISLSLSLVGVFGVWFLYSRLITPVDINMIAPAPVATTVAIPAKAEQTVPLTIAKTDTTKVVVPNAAVASSEAAMRVRTDSIPDPKMFATPVATASGITLFKATKSCSNDGFLSVVATCKDGRVKEIAANTCTSLLFAMNAALSACGEVSK